MADIRKFLDGTGLGLLWGKIQEELAAKADSTALAAVATSGDYQDLQNKPIIPEVPVQDVQLNGASILDNGIANIPISQGFNSPGLFYTVSSSGFRFDTVDGNKTITISAALPDLIKAASGTGSSKKPITPAYQHYSVFYGLAKAAGADEKNSAEAVGTYTAAAQAAIRAMLGAAAAADIPTNISAFTNDAGYLTQHQDISGKANTSDLATVATSGSYEDLSNKPTIPDVQIDGTSIVENGVANIPVGGVDTFGVVKIDPSYGIEVSSSGYARLSAPSTSQIQSANKIAGTYRPIVPSVQHISTFYGLAKAAGDSTQSASNNAVGTYTDGAKTAIQTMLDVPSNASVASQIGTAIGNVHQFELSIQQSLPSENIDTHTIYLIPKTGDTNDVYDEYVYINDGWEMIGNTQIDLSNYALKSELPTNVSGLTNDAGYLTTHQDISGKADKLNGTFTNSISLDRKENTTVGEDSVAFGYHNAATASYTVAVGRNTTANGTSAFAAGEGTIASGGQEFVIGGYNVLPAAEWEANKEYATNDYVVYQDKLYYCASPHTSAATFEQDNGWYHARKNLLTIGNGNNASSRGNAYVVDLQGNGHYKGDVYVRANADSTGGTKVATVSDIPNVPVQDVQINGTSVLSNGIANIPVATKYDNATTPSRLGLVNIGQGLNISAGGMLTTSYAATSEIKGETSYYAVITPKNINVGVFYGLAKAAGDTSQSLSNNAVGTYTESAQIAIQNMLNVPDKGIIAPAEPTLTASKAYSIGDLFINGNRLYKATAAITQGGTIVVEGNGANCAQAMMPRDVRINGQSIVSDGIANIVPADASNYGVVKIGGTDYGISINTSGGNIGRIFISTSTAAQIKAGTDIYRAITPSNQNTSVFYGLAKASGDTTQAQSNNAVGTYTSEAATAIKTMLQVQEGLRVVRLI